MAREAAFRKARRRGESTTEVRKQRTVIRAEMRALSCFDP